MGDKNIINEPLVNRDRIILAPLHIKLGLMKQFVKALHKDGDCFNYIPKMLHKDGDHMVSAWKNLKQEFLMDPKFAN